VLVGALLLLAFRQLIPHVSLWDISLFGTDIVPAPALAALVVLAVPLLAVTVTLAALRRVSVEPLGVVRRAGGVQRRMWWRLIIPAIGLLVLYPAARHMRSTTGDPSPYPLAAGVTMLLIGITTLLPWWVEATVRRIRGGSVPWQLAVRRLQLDSATAARLVSGVAVAVAGGIGLQMLFAGVQGGFVKQTGQDPSRAQVVVQVAGDLSADAFRATPGVRHVDAFQQTAAALVDVPDTGTGVVVGDCATLASLAILDSCRDGDVFLVSDPPGVDSGSTPPPPGGSRVLLGNAGTPLPGQTVGRGVPWTVPATARPATAHATAYGQRLTGIYLTPGAITGIPLGQLLSQAYLSADLSDPDTIERIRNTAAAQGPGTSVIELSTTRVDDKFAQVRHGLFLGVVAILLLIGVSLLVSMLEQLSERRRLLAMLVAVGTRRSTLGWSLLWQAAIPMLLGLALALVTGTVLGGVLLSMARAPITVDWADIGPIVGVAAAVIVGVTVLTLPMLHRLMRTGGLRTE
jgi:predicted lysophospholipase L1 biosynthesis ABC-type transport system permease subunit